LLLHRYLSRAATGPNGDPEERRAILRAAIAAAADNDFQALYRDAFERWRGFLPTDATTIDLSTSARVIIGLGAENVLETGIRLHHVYGVPFLPGSALKGLAAHYCDQVWAIPDKRFKKPTEAEDEAYEKFLSGKGPKPADNYHRLLFGTTDDSGCIVFHDAWLKPDSVKPLKLDVMTPHHPKWLDGSVAPTDFDSPVPVTFLSVTGTFHVALAWRGPASDEAKGWTELARALLRAALANWGIGGKTTSGYGRLVQYDPAKEAKPEAAATGPQYKIGQRIPVRRIKDPKGRGRDWFEADDGFGGVVPSGSPPQIEIGQSTDLEVAAVLKDGGYNFRLPRTTPEPSKPKSRPRR
jgi:CRISPR-associated protein Cmr6